MLFLSKSSVSVSFVPSRVSEPHAPISICGKVSGLGIRCLGLHRFSELSGLGCISSLSGLASLVCGYLKVAWPEICGPIFGRCSVTNNWPQTHLDRRGSSCSADCTKTQPGRQILRPVRGASKLRPTAFRYPVCSVLIGTFFFSVSSVFGGSSSRLLVQPVPRSARVRLDVASRGTGVKPTDMQPTALI